MSTRFRGYAGVCAVIVTGLLLLSCSQDEVAAPRSAEVIFESAKAKFDDEDYREAYDELRILTLQYPGDDLADDAQFLMAECKYRREEYLLAAFEYETLLRTSPTSEFVPNARFMRAMCYYESSRSSSLDQENTRKAIDEFQAFIEYHPTDARVPEAEQRIQDMNAKLAKKEYENGIIYMKMEYYRAAGIYFDLILEKYHDTEYAEPALFKKAESFYYRKRYRESMEILNRFQERYPESSLREDVRVLRGEIEKDLSEADSGKAQTITDTNRKPVP
ncbi:MAG TPA: outer membrane protein assembly factor BamD [Bacteroidota bacterium]